MGDLRRMGEQTTFPTEGLIHDFAAELLKAWRERYVYDVPGGNNEVARAYRLAARQVRAVISPATRADFVAFARSCNVDIDGD